MSLELLKQLKDKMKHNHRLAPNERIIENAGVVEDTRDFFYQDGYPVEKGTPYHIHIDDYQKAETYMTGEKHKPNSVIIYRRKGNTTFGQYKKIKPSRKKQEYLQPFKWSIKKKDISRGYSKRFFAKENFGQRKIIEVSERDGKGVPKLYQLINLKWFLGYDKALIEFQNLLSLGYAKKNGFYLYNTISPLSGFLGSENPLLDRAEELSSRGVVVLPHKSNSLVANPNISNLKNSSVNTKSNSISNQGGGTKGGGNSNMTSTAPKNSGGGGGSAY